MTDPSLHGGVTSERSPQVPPCHPERSEGSLRQAREILRCAQDDNQDTPQGQRVVANTHQPKLNERSENGVGTRFIASHRAGNPVWGTGRGSHVVPPPHPVGRDKSGPYEGEASPLRS